MKEHTRSAVIESFYALLLHPICYSTPIAAGLRFDKCPADLPPPNLPRPPLR